MSVNIMNRRIIMTPALASNPSLSSTTFDPATIQSAVLSNGNLTATHDAIVDSWSNVFSTTSYSTGKKYSEAVINVGDSNSTQIGVANSAWVTLGSNGNIGSAITSGKISVGWFTNPSGNVEINAANLTGAPIQGYGVGDVVAIAVDLGASLIWYKDLTTASNWNNSGTANPATGVGGLDISSITGGPFFFAVTTGFDHLAGSKVTVNFGGTPFTGAVPSGFGFW